MMHHHHLELLNAYMHQSVLCRLSHGEMDLLLPLTHNFSVDFPPSSRRPWCPSSRCLVYSPSTWMNIKRRERDYWFIHLPHVFFVTGLFWKERKGDTGCSTWHEKSSREWMLAPMKWYITYRREKAKEKEGRRRTLKDSCPVDGIHLGHQETLLLCVPLKAQPLIIHTHIKKGSTQRWFF